MDTYETTILKQRITQLETEIERLRERSTVQAFDKVWAERDEARAENERLRAFAKHVASQTTYLTSNPYRSQARQALGEVSEADSPGTNNTHYYKNPMTNTYKARVTNVMRRTIHIPYNENTLFRGPRKGTPAIHFDSLASLVDAVRHLTPEETAQAMLDALPPVGEE